MGYGDKYNELEKLSHSDVADVRRKADSWLIGIGLQGTAGAESFGIFVGLGYPQFQRRDFR